MLISSCTRWMRPRLAPLALALLLAPLGAVLIGQGGPEPVRGKPAAVAAADDTAAAWGRRVESMERAGTLRLRSSVEDTMIEGRVHDRFDQYVDGVRIFGAQLVRQRSAAGVESVFGSVYPEDLKIPTTPTLSADDATARVAALEGRVIGGRLLVETGAHCHGWEDWAQVDTGEGRAVCWRDGAVWEEARWDGARWALVS